MPDKETYGRFTPEHGIKLLQLTEEEQEKLQLVIESQAETITRCK